MMLRLVVTSVALLLFVSSARGWYFASIRQYSSRRFPVYSSSTRSAGSRGGGISCSPNINSHGINVEEMWPHLTGKQTCASEAAGTVS